MHENSIFLPITGGGVRRVRPMLDPPLAWPCHDDDIKIRPQIKWADMIAEPEGLSDNRSDYIYNYSDSLADAGDGGSRPG